jgi:predicted Fe-Mo cluster-binding NifX family protein
MLVKIAIPVDDDRLAGHFGEVKFFAFADAERENRAVVRSQIFAAPPHEPGSFPRWLREQGVQILIVGENGIGQRALDYLVRHGIEVFAGKPGAPVGLLIAAVLEARLPRVRNGCDEGHEPDDKAHDCRLAAYFERQNGGDERGLPRR